MKKRRRYKSPEQRAYEDMLRKLRIGASQPNVLLEKLSDGGSELRAIVGRVVWRPVRYR